MEKFDHRKDRNDETIHNNEMLPSFGGDIFLYDNCNTIKNNYSQIGLDYDLPAGIEYNTKQSKEYLAGQHHFTVYEIEVF